MKKNPKDVIAGAHHVLKPGGRFVAEFGGYLNCAGKNMGHDKWECWHTCVSWIVKATPPWRK
jgi:hypothetical protein